MPKEKLTPYQGSRRTFGFFKCPDCEKQWSSAWSWANTAQKCKECLQFIYPHSQIPLKKRKSKKNSKKQHQVDKCGKCIKQGVPCTDTYVAPGA